MSNLKVLSVIILFIFACTTPVAAQIAPLATVPMTFPGPIRATIAKSDGVDESDFIG